MFILNHSDGHILHWNVPSALKERSTAEDGKSTGYHGIVDSAYCAQPSNCDDITHSLPVCFLVKTRVPTLNYE